MSPPSSSLLTKMFSGLRSRCTMFASCALASPRAVCVITLKAGTGSCTLAPKKLKPGSYALVARYRGQPEYNASASAKKTLKVVK